MKIRSLSLNVIISLLILSQAAFASYNYYERQLMSIDYRDRLAVSEELGKIKHPDTFKLISYYIKKEKVDVVKVKMIWALGQLQSHETFDIITSELLNDFNSSVSIACLYALKNLNTADAIKPIYDFVKNAYSKDIKSIDSGVIKVIEETLYYIVFNRPEKGELIAEYLKEDYPLMVNRITIRVLGALRDQRFAANILQFVKEKEPNELITIDVLQALIDMNIANDSIVDEVKRQAMHKNPAVRAMVVNYLSLHEKYKNSTDFKFFLADSDPEVVIQALNVLTNQNISSLNDYLFNFLNYPNESVRIHAKSLLEGRSPSIMPELIKYYLISPPEMKRYLVSVVKYWDAKSFPYLYQELKSQDPAHRGVAAHLLGEIKTYDPVVVDKLHEVLKDRSTFVIFSAVNSLGKIGDSRSLNYLISLRGHASEDIRVLVYWALGELYIAEAVQYLVYGLLDSSRDVQLTARKALEKLGVSNDDIEFYKQQGNVE